jgi:putative flippase GtrA
MKHLILRVIDFFYPLFRKFMPLQTFRYAACGGANTLLDICLFHEFEHSFAKRGIVRIASFAMSPHIAALIAAFCITFPIGFYFSRYVVFTESNVRGRIQLIRYFSLGNGLYGS